MRPPVSCCSARSSVGLAGPARAADPTSVVVLRVEGAIDRTLMSYLDDRLAQAERDGSIVVLQLDTSGTLGQDGVALAERVAEARRSRARLGRSDPGEAAGRGHAADVRIVARGRRARIPDGTARAHRPAAPRGRARRARGHDRGWLDAATRTANLEPVDEPLPAADAIDLGIASVAASTVTEFLAEVDGTTVTTSGGPVTLQTRIATTESEAEAGTVALRFDNLGPIQRVAHAIATPSMVYFLLVLGLAALAFEITQPGFGFAGFAGDRHAGARRLRARRRAAVDRRHHAPARGHRPR